MLEKHPDTMTDTELYEKIDSWVSTKTPESIFIDYKKELKFNDQKEKIDLAKDVSSFANTKGGCLLYGIDEDRHNKDSAPIPKEDYGIEPIKGELIDVENILSSIISPPLPELRIRQISVENKVDKYVYLIWHPKSWMAPHMVSGFKNNRYYKRGNFKSEPMEEHEIDLLYQARSLSNIKLKDFIKNIDYGLNHVHQSDFYLKIIACPLYLSPYSKYFSYSDVSDLIEPANDIWYKISFLNGVIFIGYNKEFVIKAFFNGILSICYNIQDCIKNHDMEDIDRNINILYLKNFTPILRKIATIISAYYTKLFFYGPILINFLLENSFKMFLYYNGILWIDHMRASEVDHYLFNNNSFEFDEVFPTTNLLNNKSIVLETLINRIKYGFGCYNFEDNVKK